VPRPLRRAAILTLATLVLLELVLQLGASVLAWTHGRGPGAGGSGGRVVLCVGDSFTYGLGASNPERTSYPAQLEAQLEAGAPAAWRVVNGGHPGRDSRGLLERIDAQLAAFRPERVVILVGLNDRWRQPERLDLGATPAAARAAGEGFRLEWRTRRLMLWALGKLRPEPGGGELGGVAAFVPALAADDPWRRAPIEAGPVASPEALAAEVRALPPRPTASWLPRLGLAARELATSDPGAAVGAAVRAFLLTGDAERFGAELGAAPALDDPALLDRTLDALGLERGPREAVTAAFAGALGWRQADGVWLHPASGRQAALVTPRWLEFGPELLAAFETHRFHLEQVIARCRAAGAEPLLLGYPNRVSFPDQLFDAIAEATGVAFAPTVERFEAELGGRDAATLFVADGHCNDAGYALLAAIVRERLTGR
jgi:lysophospholipase L1-like esterase